MFHLTCVLLLVLIPLTYAQSTASTSILPREEAHVDSGSKRTLFNIIWGCISVTVICAWTSIHPNIPPHEGPFKGTLRRIELMFWAVVAPEIIPAWAVNQRLAAMMIRDIYNEQKGYEPENLGIWKTVKGWLSLSTITDAPNPAWTVKHGHFLMMGGIHIVEPVDPEPRSTAPVNKDEEKAPESKPQTSRMTILTVEMLRELIKDPEVEIQLTEEDITSRSKGDALSKLIFISQSSWFILQCIARRIQGLALTQLELTTLALASLNAIIFILWWDKPLGAQALLRVYMKRKLTEAERNAEERGSGLRSDFLQRARRFPTNVVYFIYSLVCCRHAGTCFEWFIVLPLSILALVFSPLIAFMYGFIATISDLLGNSSVFPVDATHVPTFHVPRHNRIEYLDILTLLMLGTLFGAIHCVGWNFIFPTYTEQKLWRIASLAVTALPITLALLFVLIADDPTEIRKCCSCISLMLFAICFLAYGLARLVLLGQAIAILRRLPPSAFTAIEWSQFYPHFS